MKAREVYNNAITLSGYSIEDNTTGVLDGSEDLISAVNRILTDLKEKEIASPNDEIEDVALTEALTYGIAMFISFRRRDTIANKFLSDCYNSKRAAYLSRIENVKNIYERRQRL